MPGHILYIVLDAYPNIFSPYSMLCTAQMIATCVHVVIDTQVNSRLSGGVSCGASLVKSVSK